jgi:hypothetical protein
MSRSMIMDNVRRRAWMRTTSFRETIPDITSADYPIVND